MQLTITTFRPDLVCAHLIDVERDGAVAHSITATELETGGTVTVHAPGDSTDVRLRLDSWTTVRLLDYLEDDLHAFSFACGPLIVESDDDDTVRLRDGLHGEIRLAHNDANLFALALRAALAQSNLQEVRAPAGVPA
jgi:hypothetical protein